MRRSAIVSHGTGANLQVIVNNLLDASPDQAKDPGVRSAPAFGFVPAFPRMGRTVYARAVFEFGTPAAARR